MEEDKETTKEILSIEIDSNDPESHELINKIKTLCKDYQEATKLSTKIKATLEFDLDDPHAHKKFEAISSVNRVYNVIHRIRQEIFRPARKHGYNDYAINTLIENSGGHDTLEVTKETKFVSTEELNNDNEERYFSNGASLIGELESKFSEILEEEVVDEDLQYHLE
jgi:hypothetical protein